MRVSSHTLRLALLRIFADAGSSAADGLAFPKIQQGWFTTGLRESDLRAAVHEMLECGDLRSLQRDGVLGFALAASSGHSMTWPDGELRLSTQEEENTLLQARYRDRSHSEPRPRRRAEDSAE
jgi:hypothetical protein